MRSVCALAAVWLLPQRAASQQAAAPSTTETWNYTRAGADWVTDSNECGNDLQSPVALSRGYASHAASAFLRASVPRKSSKLTLSQSPSRTAVAVDMTATEVTLAGEEMVGLYSLKEFHYHFPSEHTLEGVRYPIERHAVFRMTDEAAHVAQGITQPPAIVIATLHNVTGEADPTLDSVGIFSTAGTNGNGAIDLSVLIDAGSYYVYPGSLTKPPCDEVVVWHVSAEISPLSQEQFVKLAEKIGGLPASHANGMPDPPAAFPLGDPGVTAGNARPIQPLNGRTVKLMNYYSHAEL